MPWSPLWGGSNVPFSTIASTSQRCVEHQHLFAFPATAHLTRPCYCLSSGGASHVGRRFSTTPHTQSCMVRLNRRGSSGTVGRVHPPRAYLLLAMQETVRLDHHQAGECLSVAQGHQRGVLHLTDRCIGNRSGKARGYPCAIRRVPVYR
jgi:hypothetical protein